MEKLNTHVISPTLVETNLRYLNERKLLQNKKKRTDDGVEFRKVFEAKVYGKSDSL